MGKILLVRLLLATILAFVFQCGYGQSNNIVPPTPNAMKMTEYYSQRPNMYTGTANVNIPLHTINFDGWQLPMSISYNATGVRTNEEASEIGLGWALSATGIISRTIKEGDDLYNGGRKGYVHNAEPITFNFGYSWKTHLVPPDGSYYKSLAFTRPDTQADIFNYNFFGYSGSFVLSQKAANPTELIKAIKLTEDASSILFDEVNEIFTVITPDGYKGEFTVKEKSTTFSAGFATVNRINCCGQNNIDMAYMKELSGRFRTTTSWYLSKITSPRGQIITFNYDMKVVPSGSTFGSTYPVGSTYSPYLSNTRTFGELEGIISNDRCIQTVQEHVYLKSIVSEEVQVDFLMEEREDLRKNYLYAPDSNVWREFPASLNLKRYNGLTVKGLDPKSTLNKTIAFTQRYFNQQYHDQVSNNQNEKELRWLRSRLDRLIIDDQEYQFYYEKGGKGVPNKLTCGVDHFGFYNGQDQVTRMLPPEPVTGSFLGYSDNLQVDTATIVYYKQRWDRRVDFVFGKAGLLRKVKYPTRGYTTFEYEPHLYLPQSTQIAFREQAVTTQAGGARIMAIKQFDYTNSLLLSKSYKYVENADGSPTTGKLMTPLYNRYTQFIRDANNPPEYPVTGANFKYRTFSSIPGNNSADGKVIGYSKVHEVIIGTENYKNSYYFENRPNKVIGANSLAIGYPNLNGQATEIRNYNSLGKIVKRTVNQDYYHPIDSIKSVVYEGPESGSPNGTNPFLLYIVPYTIKQNFNTPYTVITTIPNSPSGMVEDANGNIVTWGNYIQTQKDFSYNTKYLLKTERTKNNNGEELKVEYKRPSDYASPSAALTRMLDMNVNIVDPVIEEITTKNGVVLSASGNRFNYDVTNNKINLLSSYSYNKDLGSFISSLNGDAFPAPYEEKVNFASYDPVSGKPLEYTSSDGIVNSIIWGYNKKLPLVHAIGVGYTQLNTAHLAAVGNANYETVLRNHPNVSGKLITTYDHIPLIGVTQVVNPAGVKTIYSYDQYGRLLNVVDHDAKTLQQYEYNFKYRPITRVLSVSGSLNFGTFYNCNAQPPGILTLSNLGEDDLKINFLNIPAGFSSSWSGGFISPEESVDVVITFTGSPGTYSGNVIINSNQTAGAADVAVAANATLVATGTLKTIQLSTNSLGFNQSFISKSVTVTNVGNDCLTISGLTHLSTADWSVSINNAKLAPGQSTVMTITPLKTVPEPLAITVLSDKNGGNNILQVGPPSRIIAIAPSSISIPPFNTLTTTANFTVSNSGNTPLIVTGITSSNPKFSVSPSTFTVPPVIGVQNVTITFAPTAYNFATETTTLSIMSDKTVGTGANTMTVTGARTPVRTIQLSTNALSFDFTGQNQSVTITNASTSNDYLNVSGVTPPSTSDWSTSVTNANLAPGQSTTMTITRLLNPNPATQNFTVTANKTIGNEVVQASAKTRIIGLSSSNFLPFSGPTSTQSMVVNNSGNSPLNVNNITSSNSRFTVSPTVLTIEPQTSQPVTITYTPTDFTSQSATFTVNSNATSGINTQSVTGVRSVVREMQLSANSLSFNLNGQSQSVTITNLSTSNDNLNVSGVTPPSNSDWNVSITNANLAPGQSTSMTITRLFTANPLAQSFTIGSNKTTGNGVVQASAIIREINLSNVTFPSFTGTASTQNMTISNSGNSPLNVTSISSSDSRFATSPSLFTVPVGEQQNVSITYTPTDFTSQSATITVNSNATSGVNTKSVSAQRTQLGQLSVSPLVLSIKPSLPTATTFITNTGNINATISSVNINSSANFSTTYYSGGFSRTLPYVLPPGQQMQIEVRTVGSNYSSATGTLTIFNSVGGSYIINLSRSTF